MSHEPFGWRTLPLSDVLTRITYGFTNPMPTADEGPYMLTAKDIRGGKVDYSSARRTTWEAFHTKLTNKSRPRIGDVLLTKDGSIGRVAVCEVPELCINQSVALLQLNDLVIPRFLAYLLQAPSYQAQMEADSDGSTIKHIYITRVDKMAISIPELPEQRAIVAVLGALDDKIAANEHVISLCRALVAAEFDAAVATASRAVVVGDIAEFHNRKRVPLSSRERETRRGGIPYYGAAGRLDFVDEALFDEPLVLVGEDGSVVNDDGSPIVQYVWGPSWVNNHAHVLTGVSLATETLHCALSCSNVSHLVTGAVQPKISMGNLKRLEVSVPADIGPMDEVATRYAATVRALSDENYLLVRTRDILLPLLMSGRLDVRATEQIVGEVT